MDKPNIAIIGAGLAGLQCATRLSDVARVQIFEKSRGFGGRMSTRRHELFQFDHGAQYFTARDPRFQTFVQEKEREGHIARWSPRVVEISANGLKPESWTAPRYVAQPGMNSLCKVMATTLQTNRGVRIESLEQRFGKWSLVDNQSNSYGPFDWVISTAPAPQTRDILPRDFEHADQVERVTMQGCFSLMVGVAADIGPDWDVARINGGPLAWLSRNDSKPGRAAPMSFLGQSTNQWAEDHMEDDKEWIERELVQAFSDTTGIAPSSVEYLSVHRWRYANTTRPAGSPYLLDGRNCLAAAGDWCIGGRVEAAFVSASELAERIVSFVNKR